MEIAPVISYIEQQAGAFTVYNFTVEDFHTYYVSSTQVLVHNSEPCNKKYSNKRPKYARGQIKAVWDRAKKESTDGIVRDPNTGEELYYNAITGARNWDMGHKYGMEYWRMKEKYINGEITEKYFLEWFQNPDNYQPEARGANRSHRYEKKD